jgi:hypothetical protein
MSISKTSSRRSGLNAVFISTFLSLGCFHHPKHQRGPLIRESDQDSETDPPRVDGTNFESRGVEAYYILLHLLGTGVRVVTDVQVVWKVHGKLAVGELTGWHCEGARGTRRGAGGGELG